MMLASSALGFAPMAPVAAPMTSVTRAAAPAMETKADLVTLAEKLNPVVGFWDPMNLVEYDQWSQGEEAAIGFLRHAEIKHGRIAMFAFVGYVVQSNGVHWPWNIESSGLSFGDISAAGSPPEQFDALSSAAKIQFFTVIAFLELIGENSYALEQSGEKHYMRGGKPGFYPSLKKVVPHPVPFDLFDPFGLSAKASPEKKERGLLAEINNGRLAMLGIMAFVAESKVPGSVPALGSLGIKPYAGEVMAPFSASNADLPFVSEMLGFQSLFN
jgi:hypothetical protein